jgi:hypothetical protein
MVGSMIFGRSTEKVVVIGGSCSGDVVSGTGITSTATGILSRERRGETLPYRRGVMD